MKKLSKIEYLATWQLQPSAHNARTHSHNQIKQIAASIKKFNFINPVIIDAKNTIIAGHGRALAAQQLGLKVIPVIRIEHLSEAEKRAYMLADNKLTENAGWDQALLKIELSYLTEIKFDLELTGFNVSELDVLLQSDTTEVEPSPPPPPVIPVSQMGDIWNLGPHRIICGDCRISETLKHLMQGRVAAMVITDPPYNVRIIGHARGKGKSKHTDFAMASGEMNSSEFIEFLSAALGNLVNYSADGSLHYVFMDWRHNHEILTAGSDIYTSQQNLAVWVKTNGGMGSFYRSQHELVFIYKHGKKPHTNNIELGQHGRYRTNVWSYAGVNSFSSDREEALTIHPTVKPVQMIADAILDASRRNDIILDGFLGSGTTLIAAEKTSRICYGIEIDPRYVDVAINRWMEITGQEAVLENTGHSYSKVKSKRLKGKKASK